MQASVTGYRPPTLFNNRLFPPAVFHPTAARGARPCTATILTLISVRTRARRAPRRAASSVAQLATTTVGVIAAFPRNASTDLATMALRALLIDQANRNLTIGVATITAIQIAVIAGFTAFNISVAAYTLARRTIRSTPITSIHIAVVTNFS